MIYFCADDYGISNTGNSRIEECLENGVLNKVSVLPNGEISDFKNRLMERGATLSLHINLVEGRPLSDSADIGLLISDDGCFKYSFAGLFLLSLSSKRKEFEKQIYKEIQSQIKFWKEAVGKDISVSVDSHQHTHMIPVVFKTLMRVIKDENLSVERLRIPSEPALPYVLSPSLYFSYSFSGLIKQWILKILALVNRAELKKANLKSAYFMGVMFSGKLNEIKIKKLLLHYLKKAKKNGKDIEIGFHPGYIKSGEELMSGIKDGFSKFYFSPWRKIEHDALLDFKFETKEG